MIKKEFLRQVQQLLYSLGEMEGMITRAEEHDLLDRVAQILSGNGEHRNGYNPELKKLLEVPGKPSPHIDAAHALNTFLDFVDEHREHFSEEVTAAFREVAAELARVYDVTSKREKTLITELKHKSGLNGH
jgi:hypothetical protein